MPSDLYARARAHPLMERFSRSPYAAKVTKYAIGSVIALATSIVVFALAYVILSGHPTTCSILAFFAGAIPNWVLNRRWAWKMKGARRLPARDRRLHRDLGGRARRLLAGHRRHADAGSRATSPPITGSGVILVTGAYVFVQAVLFVVKFLIYEKWVFSGQSRLRAAVRSRHQVWTAARANRTP